MVVSATVQTLNGFYDLVGSSHTTLLTTAGNCYKLFAITGILFLLVFGVSQEDHSFAKGKMEGGSWSGYVSWTGDVDGW